MQPSDIKERLKTRICDLVYKSKYTVFVVYCAHNVRHTEFWRMCESWNCKKFPSVYAYLNNWSGVTHTDEYTSTCITLVSVSPARVVSKICIDLADFIKFICHILVDDVRQEAWRMKITDSLHLPEFLLTIVMGVVFNKKGEHMSSLNFIGHMFPNMSRDLWQLEGGTGNDRNYINVCSLVSERIPLGEWFMFMMSNQRGVFVNTYQNSKVVIDPSVQEFDMLSTFVIPPVVSQYFNTPEITTAMSKISQLTGSEMRIAPTTIRCYDELSGNVATSVLSIVSTNNMDAQTNTGRFLDMFMNPNSGNLNNCILQDITAATDASVQTVGIIPFRVPPCADVAHKMDMFIAVSKLMDNSRHDDRMRTITELVLARNSILTKELTFGNDFTLLYAPTAAAVDMLHTFNTDSALSKILNKHPKNRISALDLVIPLGDQMLMAIPTDCVKFMINYTNVLDSLREPLLEVVGHQSLVFPAIVARVVDPTLDIKARYAFMKCVVSYMYCGQILNIADAMTTVFDDDSLQSIVLESIPQLLSVFIGSPPEGYAEWTPSLLSLMCNSKFIMRVILMFMEVTVKCRDVKKILSILNMLTNGMRASDPVGNLVSLQFMENVCNILGSPSFSENGSSEGKMMPFILNMLMFAIRQNVLPLQNAMAAIEEFYIVGVDNEAKYVSSLEHVNKSVFASSVIYDDKGTNKNDFDLTNIYGVIFGCFEMEMRVLNRDNFDSFYTACFKPMIPRLTNCKFSLFRVVNMVEGDNMYDRDILTITHVDINDPCVDLATLQQRVSSVPEGKTTLLTPLLYGADTEMLSISLSHPFPATSLNKWKEKRITNTLSDFDITQGFRSELGLGGNFLDDDLFNFE